MKKAMVYILALTLAFTTVLSGCGENSMNRTEKPAGSKPETTVAPEQLMPDPEDGVVSDHDGIITDGDTGSKPDSGKPAETGETDAGKTAGAKNGTSAGTGKD